MFLSGSQSLKGCLPAARMRIPPDIRHLRQDKTSGFNQLIGDRIAALIKKITPVSLYSVCRDNNTDSPRDQAKGLESSRQIGRIKCKL
ncbi:MAG: hypothetical protein WBB19_12000 [Desulforhopalus sp.]